jgi:hypothetical protein
MPVDDASQRYQPCAMPTIVSWLPIARDPRHQTDASSPGDKIAGPVRGRKGGGMATGGRRMTESPRKDGREALRTLSDKPLEDDAGDRLDFVAYADALAELLDHPDTDTPLTIAISAQWGAGKTSLAKMVERRLEQRPIERSDPPHVTCWFNAWMHDDAPHLGAAFAAEVAKTADRYRPMWRRLFSPLPSAMLSPEQRWKRRLGIALVSAAVAVAIAVLPGPGRVLRQVFAPDADIVDRLEGLFGSTRVGAAILVLLVFAFWRKVFAIAQAAARFVDDPKSEAAKGSMQDVSTQLGQLIAQATHIRRQWLIVPRDPRRFVIFVDDLERCQPPRAVEVCEVASQLLGHPNVVTVLVADMATVATSAETKYAEHLRTGGTQNPATASLPGFYGRLYLQKIVQIQFNLPPSPAKRMPGLLMENDRRSESRHLGKQTESPARPRDVGTLRVFGSVLGVISLLALVVESRVDISQQISLVGRFIIVLSTVGATVVLITTLGHIGQAVLRDYRKFRTRQAQRQIDQDIRKVVAAGATTVDAVLKRLGRQSLEMGRYGLARQRAQRMLTDSSVRRTQAETEIKDHLPTLPRSAKRLFNHLRVLLVIAEQKHMFGGQPELQAIHIGKWAVLLEQWPELGSALTADPVRLTELETATTIEELSKRLGPSVPASAPSQNLLDFLRSPTKLAPVVERLVYFEPAASHKDVETISDGLIKVDTISPASGANS